MRANNAHVSSQFCDKLMFCDVAVVCSQLRHHHSLLYHAKLLNSSLIFLKMTYDVTKIVHNLRVPACRHGHVNNDSSFMHSLSHCINWITDSEFLVSCCCDSRKMCLILDWYTICIQIFHVINLINRDKHENYSVWMTRSHMMFWWNCSSRNSLHWDAMYCMLFLHVLLWVAKRVCVLDHCKMRLN